ARRENPRVPRRQGAREPRAGGGRGRQGGRHRGAGARNADDGDREREGSLSAGPRERDCVSTKAEVFLGVIALATLTMAVVQVGIIVAAGVLARRLSRLADQV